MSHEIFLIIAVLATSTAAGWLLYGIVHKRTRLDYDASAKLHDVMRYSLELNDDGKLECTITLLDGRVLFFVTDPIVTYDLSNAFLGAASRLGSKRHGMIVLEDPADAAPHVPTMKAKVKS